jgi:hypothetical protein
VCLRFVATWTLIPGGEDDAAFMLQGAMYGAKHCLGHDGAMRSAGLMSPDPAQYYRSVAEGLMDPRFTMPTRGGVDDDEDSTAAEKILEFALDTRSAPMLYPPVEISGTIRAGGDFLGSSAAEGSVRMFGGSLETDGYMQSNFTHMPWIVEVYAWMTIQDAQLTGMPDDLFNARVEVAALFATVPGTAAGKDSRAGTVAMRLSISAEFGAQEARPGIIPCTIQSWSCYLI